MRAITIHRPLLKVIWKLVMVLLFPCTIWLYSIIADIPFSSIDQGANHHKWIIFFVYLAVLIAWFYLDRNLSHRAFFRR